MGHWSDKSIEISEGIAHRGATNKHVCSDCVVDSALSELVRESSNSNRCDYCEVTSEHASAAPLEPVLDQIERAIYKYYDDANQVGVAYDKGYVTPEIDSYEVIGSFNPGWSAQFIEDVADHLGHDNYWAEHYEGSWTLSDPRSALIYGWKGFKELVTTKTRYVFASEPEDEFESDRPDYVSLPRMVETIAKLISKHGTMRELSKGDNFHRVRVAQESDQWSNFDDLGAPPVRIASAGRMNPAGIPYFYLASDLKTAVAEVVYTSTKYYHGEFKLNRDIRIIDLANLPDSPSPFLIEKYDDLHEIAFLREFVSDLSLPIKKDGLEHIDYVPTQIISEFLRHRFTDADGAAVDGLLYRSARHSEGVNLVVFRSDNSTLKEIFTLDTIHERHSIISP